MNDITITKAQYVAFDGENVSITIVVEGSEISVPLDSANRHYIAIQEWIAEGNTIEDAD
tara:strand:+ start:632 stop:808 length:177 start_codon:yes stop_codon:yes gene_type:complete